MIGRRSGFTLFEVVVALAIGGVVLASAAALLNGLADIGERIVRSGAAWDRDANADRLLLELVASAEPGIGEEPGITGDARSARFTTWCDDPAGWKVRCEAEIAFVEEARGLALVARVSNGEPIRLRSGLAVGRILYLPSLGGRDWTDSWQSIVMPVALAFELDTRTILAPIGDRG